MSSAGATTVARTRWVPEDLTLSYGTRYDGTRWRLRYDGALWNAEQLDGTWQTRGARAEYRAAQALVEQLP